MFGPLPHGVPVFSCDSQVRTLLENIAVCLVGVVWKALESELDESVGAFFGLDEIAQFVSQDVTAE